MSWECSGKELVSRIERLGRSEMLFINPPARKPAALC